MHQQQISNKKIKPPKEKCIYIIKQGMNKDTRCKRDQRKNSLYCSNHRYMDYTESDIEEDEGSED
jgi:hypothetical protein